MKYKVGDKVRVKDLDWYNENKKENGDVCRANEPLVIFSKWMSRYCGKKVTIKDIDSNIYWVEEINIPFADFMLEDEVVKEEPLDLTKILEGCEGIELWIPLYGKVKLNNIIFESRYEYPIELIVENNEYSVSLTKDGYFDTIHDETAEIMLFPSKEQRDWSKFKEPRWRAEYRDMYWYVTDCAQVYSVKEYKYSHDNERYDCGNYFRTKEEAEGYAEKVRNVFKGGFKK